MELKEVLKLIDAVSKSGITNFSMKRDGFKISMEAGNIVTAEAKPAVRQETMQPEEEEGNIIVSPIVGTFYSGPSPEEEDFVKPGDRVKKGQTIGIIEAMKLMNEVECEYDGTVDKILVKNEETVEYGQPLFSIRPN